MRLDTSAAPSAEAVQVGDVYATRGPGPARFWLVMALRGEAAHCAGLDEGGRIVTTASYGQHALRERDLLGRTEELSELVLTVQWRQAR